MVFIWILFLFLTISLMVIDLWVFYKKHTISLKDSLFWITVWILVAILFSIPIFYLYKADIQQIDSNNLIPSEAVLVYITTYIIEISLNLDIIFVIALIFRFLNIPLRFQHSILFWSIIGIILFNGIMLAFGGSFVRVFSLYPGKYIIGCFLLFSAYIMLKANHEVSNFKNNPALSLHGKFFIRTNSKHTATSLFACFIVLEYFFIVYSIDSIPAIFAITTDSFIVFISNVFAMLGLRSLYFFLANILDRFYYLKYSFIVILFYIGIKMLVIDLYKFPALLSLIIILLSLIIGILLPILMIWKKGKNDLK